jgi:hypothetical protein
MRLASVAVAVLLLFSPLLFAQHSSATGSSSGGSSSGGSSNSTSSSGSSHGSSSGGSSGGSSSGSASSSSHSGGASASSNNHAASGSGTRNSSADPATHGAGPASTTRNLSTQPATRRQVDNNVHVRNHGIADPKNKQPEHRGFLARLRHPLRKAPTATEADLRRRKCPPGQSAGKNGSCVSTPALANTASACQANAAWNGSVCTGHCKPGESWSGTECVIQSEVFGSTADQCAMFSSRANLLAVEARSIHRDMDAACNKDPYGQECMRLTQSHDGAVQRYEMLMNEAPLSCRAMLPDPLSL